MSGKYSEWLAMKNLPSILGLDKYIIDKFENLQDDWLKYRINVNKYYYAIWCITLLLNGMVDIFILGISAFLFFYNKNYHRKYLFILFLRTKNKKSYGKFTTTIAVCRKIICKY